LPRIGLNAQFISAEHFEEDPDHLPIFRDAFGNKALTITPHRDFVDLRNKII